MRLEAQRWVLCCQLSNDPLWGCTFGVEFLYPVLTSMPGGVTVGDSGLCCWVFCLLSATHSLCLLSFHVPKGSPSRGVDAAVFAFDKNQPSLPTPFFFFFYCVLVSVSLCVALSIVFHSINSLENSAFSLCSSGPVLTLPHWSFRLYISLWKSPSALI